VHLAFLQAPAKAVAGDSITPIAVVAIEDQVGNVITTDNSQVTLTLTGGPGNTSTVLNSQVVNGIASFDSVAPQNAGNYTLDATDGTDASASAALTVTPAPVSSLVFLQQPTNVVAGQDVAPAIVVQAKDEEGNVISGDVVTLAIEGYQSGTVYATFIATTDSSGKTTFANVSLPTAGSYTVVATDGTLSNGSSSTFAVSAAVAAQLVFAQQPGNVSVGAAMSPSVVVDVEDQFGNLVTTDNSMVTLSLNGAAVLNGTQAVQAKNGVATFGGLSVSDAGVYTIDAGDGVLASVTSLGFTVSPATAVTTVPSAPSSITYDGTTDVTNWAVSVVNGANGGAAPTGVCCDVFYAGSSATGTPLASPPINAGTYTVVAEYAGDANYRASCSAPVTFVVNQATPVFGKLSPSSRISHGTSSVVFSGTIAAGTVIPPCTESIAVTLNGVTHSAVIDSHGNFSSTFNTSKLPISATPYKVSYAYAGDANLRSALDNKTTTITVHGFGAATRVVFSTQPASTAAGATIPSTVQVSVVDANGYVVTNDNSKVTLAIGANPGRATLGGTVTAVAVNGVATFHTLSIAKAGTGYTLKAKDGALAGATSGSFNVTPAAAKKLVFGTQPRSTVASAIIAPAVTVSVEDTYGNVVTGDISSVTISLGTNRSGGTLGGTMTVQAVNGVATFNNLSISKAGTGYALAVTDGKLMPATSVAFNVTVAPTLTVTNPNRGAVLQVGMTYTISWAISGDTSAMNCQYVGLSTDGGVSYVNISAALSAAARSFKFTPSLDKACSAAMIRVEAMGTGGQCLCLGTSNGTFSIQNTSPAPVIVGLSPASGPAAGRTIVSIQGKNLGSPTTATVFFGGAQAAILDDDGTTLAVFSPAGSGTVDIRVTTAAGESLISSADQFTYTGGPVSPPSVIGISPAYGPATGDTVVTINGTNLLGAKEVLFGGVPGAMMLDTKTGIIAVSPAGSGTVDVRIVTAAGESAVVAGDEFTYAAAAGVLLGVGVSDHQPGFKVETKTTGTATATATAHDAAIMAIAYEGTLTGNGGNGSGKQTNVTSLWFAHPLFEE
jgi:hypothetical protein